jgi:hypothetical protein
MSVANNFYANPFASLMVLAIDVLMLVGYFWIRPRLGIHKEILQNGKIRWTAKHEGWTAYFDLHFIVIMWMIPLVILPLAPWRWPNTWDSLMYDIFIIRVGGRPDYAHVWTYMVIPTVFFTAWKKIRLTTWQAFLSATFMVFLHEGIWFIFYYSRYFTLFELAKAAFSDFNYLALVASFFLVYWKVYGLNRRILIVVLPQFLYDGLWFVLGFPITYSSDPRISALYNIPQWTGVLWVNQIEVSGWLLMLASMLVWLSLSTGRRGNTDRIVHA